MKKTLILLAAFVLCQSVSFSQISIKAPKFGKTKEEKKTETIPTTETSVKQNETVKPQEVIKKEEPVYYYTTYTSSKDTNVYKEFTGVSSFNKVSEEKIVFYYKTKNSGSESNEGGEYYKKTTNSFIQSPRNCLYLFIQDNGSYIVTSHDGSWANLFSTNIEHVKNAPNKESLIIIAKESIDKIKTADLLKDINKNSEEFKNDVVLTSKNINVENQFKAALFKSDANLAEKDKCNYKKVILDSPEWAIVKNDLGVPLKKTFDVTIIAENANKQCFYFYGSMKKDYLGGGKYSDVVKFNEGNQFADGSYRKYISCDLVK